MARTTPHVDVGCTNGLLGAERASPWNRTDSPSLPRPPMCAPTILGAHNEDRATRELESQLGSPSLRIDRSTPRDERLPVLRALDAAGDYKTPHAEAARETVMTTEHADRHRARRCREGDPESSARRATRRKATCQNGRLAAQRPFAKRTLRSCKAENRRRERRRPGGSPGRHSQGSRARSSRPTEGSSERSGEGSSEGSSERRASVRTSVRTSVRDVHGVAKRISSPR